MRILLVNMPWASVDVPSLALGILSNAVRARVDDAEVTLMHANLDFADWISERMPFSMDDYVYYSMASYFIGCGDWVFSSALHGGGRWRAEEFRERFGPGMPEPMWDKSLQLHDRVPEFVTATAERIVAQQPDLVGFTTTFQQNVAALATAAEVKRLDPSIRTVFGGANCDGPQGAAMHRNFGQVDYVARGEGEVSFPSLVEVLAAGGDPAGVPGLCWGDREGGSVANRMTAAPLAPARIVAPDYDAYFARLDTSVVREWCEPKLVVEGSRGCWWGEKHHCTFCGLNGSFMEFRSKGPDRFYDEIVDYVKRYRILDMYVVDNIMDMGYLGTLLPRMIESGYDLRLQYEIKSNLRREQLATMAQAGLVHVQPGIENLSSRVLKIMDKGVTGCQNVRLLRDAETLGVSLAWNYLYGFPEESAEDYDEIVRQMPALHHLQPPAGSVRLVVERFSPYFDRPELGFPDLEPDDQYRIIYDLPDAELRDLAYMFSSTPRGIDDATADRLGEAIGRWRRVQAVSRLTLEDRGDHIRLVSDRPGYDWDELQVEDPLELALLRLLDQPHAPKALARKLGEQLDTPVSDVVVAAALERFVQLGVVFAEAGQYVHLATASENQPLLRYHYQRTLAATAHDRRPLAARPA